MAELLVKYRKAKKILSKQTLNRIVDRVLEISTGKKEFSLSIIFCDDDYITELNRKYRGIDEPTDVLAFSMQEGLYAQFNPGQLGDIIISYDTASRNAKKYGNTLTGELVLLVCHGILHLLGHDDVESENRRKMKKLQKECVAAALKIVAADTKKNINQSG